MRPNPQETVDLVTFTEEILDGKLFFLQRKCLFVWTLGAVTRVIQLT